ncbi:LysE family translocator [Actibacterium sp. XHP0104]|uniref:LysE family translocator n=1 Tax=Actibacterium sp. XHP0104 TaxID=2984335 RepID=UPI0021E95693|nr:LysE family translocator [Actibacterium sp. XHP0104]MCV2881985.1 LysE family translocator [Actibacterium sp. XHP0104]
MFQTAAALIVFLFPLAYSPGPGNMFFAAMGARFGFAATVPASIGYHVATWIVTVAIGSGFVVVMDQLPQLFVALKLAGSAYVLWIAWKLFRAGAVDADPHARPAGYWDGVILLTLNPKAYVIIALMFTQFLGGVQSGQLLAVLLISTVFTLNNLVAFSVWTVIGQKIARLFRAQDSARRLNRMFGVILALVAVWMLVS